MIFLQQSISSNLTAINTLQTNLTNNYFTKDEITDNLSNYLDITTFESFGNELGEVVMTMSNDITTINNEVLILTEDIICMQKTFNFPLYGNINFGIDVPLEGTWKLYGTVTLYIPDISKMTPTDNVRNDNEWINALPILEIVFKRNSDTFTRIISTEKIEANRPLMTIHIDEIVPDLRGIYRIDSNIDLPSPNDINITEDDICTYRYNLYLERISGYQYIYPESIE